MHEYEIKLLAYLREHGNATLEDIRNSLSLGNDQIVWAIESLAERNAIRVERTKQVECILSDEGKECLKEFPEERFIKAVAKKGRLSVKECSDGIGFIWAKKNGWILIDDGFVVLSEKGNEMLSNGNYGYRELLNALSNANTADIDSILSKAGQDADTLSKKRKLFEIKSYNGIKSVAMTDIGMKLSSSDSNIDGISTLTRDIIANGWWKGKMFRPYNVDAPSVKVYPARLHPVHEFINNIRDIWLRMGFIEGTGPIIDSAFWDFDVLFSPQDHPTREMQDTFFLSNPKDIDIDDIELLSKVRRMHKKAWSRTWSEKLAKQALLRTHTTVVSAHYMQKLAGMKNMQYPMKIFSIGKVFRNESLDYKHLAELYQYDGIIVGEGIGLSHLIYTLKEFYAQLGMKVRIKPAYFPFVEPGLEVHYFDKKLNDWIELCGGGVIRDEITGALGIKKNVLAWGGGLDRLMFNKLEIKTLSELYRNEIDWLRSRKNMW
ncbi:MAG: phenylalanine--tRNA ligase subunit alpha [Candidatus Marsarchaeota archaeon]|nr:phenylalanine--tRNA ligase subunit alpha [Candidatus Marsarchaeota archaeon]